MINDSTGLAITHACWCHAAARDYLTAMVEEAAEEAAKVADTSALAMSHAAAASDDDDGDGDPVVA